MKLPQIEPMTLSRVAAPFDHPDFLFELKQDGFRCVAYIAEGGCDLVSRRNNHYKSFDSLKTALAILKAKTAILDGETVSLDSGGRSQFKELLYRRGEPTFYAFDLLWLNGRDLRELPLTERKKRLHKLIEKSDCKLIIYAQHIEEHGTALFREMCEKDVEGIVCKRKDGAYSASAHWLKALNPTYTQHAGGHEKFTTFQSAAGRISSR
jgi:bifunctional non-homologous end joining protein LigD